MHTPPLLAASALLLATLGCRDDTTAPTDPAATNPAKLVAAATLAFWQVSAGVEYGCGVTTEYRAYCWGNNWDGQLGIGSWEDDYPVPVAVVGGLSFKQVDAGKWHTCGVTTANRAYCWGGNYGGQLGDGTQALRTAPVRVAGARSFRQVSAGWEHTCAVTSDDRAYCWGSNAYGQLGDGTTTQRLRPVAVLGGLTFKQVSAGWNHTCGITTANRAYCWGYNRYGQVGDSSGAWTRLRPVRVRSTQQYRVVSAGYRHTCAVTTGDRAFCWGWNKTGELGDGTTIQRRWPRAVSGGLYFNRVTAGGWHIGSQVLEGTSYTCAITPANRAYCWGNNSSGQLGDGTNTQRLRPVRVGGGLYFKQVDAGGRHTCGKSSTVAAYCWGSNDWGQLGNGTSDDSSVPVPVY